MKRSVFLVLLAGLLLPHDATSEPVRGIHEFSEPQVELDTVGRFDGTPPPQKVLQDTTWIADWTFDAPNGECTDEGWEHVDNHVLNDGVVYWEVTAGFAGTGGIVGQSAALGYHDNFCCEEPNGYDNDWYQAIRIEYQGSGELSFDYLIDSEPGFDFLLVEEDSACASFELVDFDVDPSANAAAFRNVLLSDSGFNLTANVGNLPFSDYGTTSCLYIAFFADGGFSPCDGFQSSSIGEALVVDNIVVIDQNGTRSEDFEDGTLDIGTFENIQDSTPFGTWARLFRHVTDNDVCTENTTCAWIWTDHTTPTVANDPSMAFGPGGFVVRNWLDDIIVSPWVSLASTPNATGTYIQFRRFPGNFFNTSRLVQNWSVRGRRQVDGGGGGTTECVSNWGHVFRWNSLSLFRWVTMTWNMSSEFDPTSEAIQVRHRTSDWQWIAGASPPSSHIPGPGPYLDRVRIGRQTLTGPVLSEGIDARSQAQDGFATIPMVSTGPPTHELFQPSTDRFGSAAFTRGTELGIGASSLRILTGDSITIEAVDVRGAGGITSVDLYGAIVSGPHAGKAPIPYTVGANGFFVIAADSARSSGGSVVDERWFIDIDDTYLRGGDVMHYFWLSSDAQGGVSSDPVGLNAVPASIEEAQEATQGMLEVSALPKIRWSQDYLDRIAADPNGDLEPTEQELADSEQGNCILYVNRINSRRRSGDINRTSFMYTLDAIGYRGAYDVYDHTGMGNTNNHLGGRATIEQAQGYNLIVYDAGNVGPSGTIMPDGIDLDSAKVDQQAWFINWLNQAATSEAQFATLWVLGSNFVEEYSNATLYTSTMAVTLNSTNQSLNVNPDVEGQSAFTFDQGTGSASIDFTGDEFSLQGGCPVIRNYDGLGSGGQAVETHVYRDPISGATGDAAIVMNSNPADNWNTIAQSHPWFDIRDLFGGGPPDQPTPARALLERVLMGALPLNCRGGGTTDTDRGDELDVPVVTALHPNVPNPFNPVTRIAFDLARDGHVSLRIYDVGGRLVRTLIDAPMARGRYAGADAAVWDGIDDAGRRVSSGVYFYRLVTSDLDASRRMVLLK
jgi:hypothetical protein